MLKIGCHLSSSKGTWPWERGREDRANTFQFFTRNPRGGKAKPLDLEDMAAYRPLPRSTASSPLLAHAPYHA